MRLLNFYWDMMSKKEVSEKITKAILVKYPAGYRNGLKKPPKDPEGIKKLADELIAWSYSKNATAIEEFPLSKLLVPYRFYQLAKNDEYFADALAHAKYNIGARLQKMVLFGSLHSDHCLKLLPTLNPEFREWQIEKTAKQIEAVRASAAQFIVQIPADEVSDLVPDPVN